jgi:multiple sugar transport system permease protein
MSKKSVLCIHLILTLGSLIMVFPFVWMILSSFKTVGELTRIPIQLLPTQLSFTNYEIALNVVPFGRMYWNTLLMMIGRIACAVVFSSMAAYGFARIEFPFKNTLFALVLFQMMVPNQIFLIPQYLMLAEIGMLNSIFALIFPGLVSAFGTFLMRQFFLSLPKELEEAAIIDGCHRGQIFLYIMVPLVKSGMVALSVFTALFSWKDLMWPLVVNMNIDLMPISAGLAVLRGIEINNEGALMAGATMAFLPMLIIYIFSQKQFVEGIAQSGIKG